MKKCLGILLLTTMITSDIYSQQTDSSGQKSAQMQNEKAFTIKPWVDIPVTLALDIWSYYGLHVINGRDLIPEAEIRMLNKNNINSFDRPIADNYSPKSKSASDKFFFGSMPLPLLLLLDKKIRKDGLKVGLLYLETMGTTGALYTISAMLANRYRPYAYNENVDIDTRTKGGVKNSFFAGHPALVASCTFFTAQVYAHYHPNMKCKWILYTIAAGATAATGILRMQSGNHFRTDVITGVTLGTLVGIFVPYIHQNRSFAKHKLALLPNFQHGATGFTAYYKLGK